MIKRVLDLETANVCDELLTKLIQDERQYDESIDENFIVKDYFKNVISNEDNILLCYMDENIVKGYIYLKPTGDNKKGYLIDGLYVKEEYRNNGIGKALISEAINLIKDKEVDYIDINVMNNNLNAIKLYKSLNFNEFRITFRKDL